MSRVKTFILAASIAAVSSAITAIVLACMPHRHDSADARERYFLVMSSALVQAEFDRGRYKDSEIAKNFSEFARKYMGVDENTLYTAIYGKSPIPSGIPNIVYEPGVGLYESHDYPVNNLVEDRLEVEIKDYKVKWVKSGEVVK